MKKPPTNRKSTVSATQTSTPSYADFEKAWCQGLTPARSFGYRAGKNPSAVRRDREAFVGWMRRKWKEGAPVMLPVDSAGSQDEADHWWTVYGDPGQANVWVMEPLDDRQPFQCRSIADVMAFAACNDGEGYLEYDGVAVSPAPGSDRTGIPASARLMEFLNENRKFKTGWSAHPIAAALVDNHFSSVNGLDSQGKARGARAVAVSNLLADQGPVETVIDEWDVFFSGEQRANLTALQAVLLDIELHLGHTIAASEVDALTREIVLNLILIGTNLMDG